MSTIAAISTAIGKGGIGIIRISGEKTFELIKKIFIEKNPREEIVGYTMKYGNIVDPETEETIDEVLVSFFKKPHSYTAEDMCEINSHGGIIIVKRILEICLKSGAELAEPGEFTKRAFLNGRIDLSQAEAIIDIINSKSEKESKASIKQLEGNLSNKIQKIREKIINNMVDIEASIDYPEYDVEEVQREKLRKELQSVYEELDILKNSFKQGKIIKEGIKVAIIGKPNAGKSSLLNAFLGENRAIVTEIEGTTRDSIEESLSINGIPLVMVDTAGIREEAEIVEKIGIERAKKIAEEADLIILIIDITKSLDQEGEQILESIQNKKAIIVLNKIDEREENKELEEAIKKYNKKVLKVSAKMEIGMEEIKEEITKMFQIGEIDMENSDSVIITNVRHENAIKQSLEKIQEALQGTKMGMPIDVIAIPMKDALEDLGLITGEAVSEEIINGIFAKFCLGK